MAASNYYLQVTAGPSYDRSTHRLLNVNSTTPLFISQPHADINLSVKIQNYRGSIYSPKRRNPHAPFPLPRKLTNPPGLPEGSPATSRYFSHPSHLNDQYSISFTLLPKQSIRGDNIIFGNDFDNPIRDRLPPGFNAAFKIVKWVIDPGLEGDAYSDTPYLYGPALSSLNILRVGERRGELPEWRDEEIAEEGGEERGKVPADAGARRRWFLREEERTNWVFESGRVYWGDFFNGYLDFNNFALRLPGFTLPIIKYLDMRQETLRPHKLRYVLKNRETGDVYFVVVFTMLRKDGRDGGDEGGFVSGSDDEAALVSGSDDEVVLVNGKGEKGGFVPREDDVD